MLPLTQQMFVHTSTDLAPDQIDGRAAGEEVLRDLVANDAKPAYQRENLRHGQLVAHDYVAEFGKPPVERPRAALFDITGDFALERPQGWVVEFSAAELKQDFGHPPCVLRVDREDGTDEQP